MAKNLRTINFVCLPPEGLCQVISSKLLPRNMIADPFEKQDFEGGVGRLVGTDRSKAERVLLLWYFEDQLRAAYRKLLGALQEVFIYL